MTRLHLNLELRSREDGRCGDAQSETDEAPAGRDQVRRSRVLLAAEGAPTSLTASRAPLASAVA
jgi:hypothetical protein